MSPVWIIEGGARSADPVLAERDLAERKLSALADAVKEHEDGVRRERPDARPQDVQLYDRLREIETLSA
jgi:hypothetical protein